MARAALAACIAAVADIKPKPPGAGMHRAAKGKEGYMLRRSRGVGAASGCRGWPTQKLRRRSVHLRRRGIVCCRRGGGKRAHERVIGTLEVHTLGIGPVGKRADADRIFSCPLKYGCGLALLYCCAPRSTLFSIAGRMGDRRSISLRSVIYVPPGRAATCPCTPYAVQNPHTPAPYLQDGILAPFHCSVLMSEDRGSMRP